MDPPTTATTRPIVTGTTVLGVKYSGGVMLAADTLASYGSLARYKDMRKWHVAFDDFILFLHSLPTHLIHTAYIS